MIRRLVRRVDVRPFVALALILLVGTYADRIFSGVVSVLVLITVAVLGSLIAATVATVREDARRNARWQNARLSVPVKPWWHSQPRQMPVPAAPAPVAPIAPVTPTPPAADAKDAA